MLVFADHQTACLFNKYLDFLCTPDEGHLAKQLCIVVVKEDTFVASVQPSPLLVYIDYFLLEMD